MIKDVPAVFALQTTHPCCKLLLCRPLKSIWCNFSIISVTCIYVLQAMLAVVLDIYLLMCVESGMLKPFLLSCSSESWFRSVAMVLKIPTLDHKQLEKISVLLQKLSKIKWVLRYWGLRKDIVLSLLCPFVFLSSCNFDAYLQIVFGEGSYFNYT